MLAQRKYHATLDLQNTPRLLVQDDDAAFVSRTSVLLSWPKYIYVVGPRCDGGQEASSVLPFAFDPARSLFRICCLTPHSIIYRCHRDLFRVRSTWTRKDQRTNCPDRPPNMKQTSMMVKKSGLRGCRLSPQLMLRIATVTQTSCPRHHRKLVPISTQLLFPRQAALRLIKTRCQRVAGHGKLSRD